MYNTAIQVVTLPTKTGTVTEPSLCIGWRVQFQPYAGLLLFLIASQVNHRLQETSFDIPKNERTESSSKTNAGEKDSSECTNIPLEQRRSLLLLSLGNTINKNVR